MEEHEVTYLAVLICKSLSKAEKTKEIAMIASKIAGRFTDAIVVETSHDVMASAIGECIVEDRIHTWRSHDCKYEYESVGFLIEKGEDYSNLFRFTKYKK